MNNHINIYQETLGRGSVGGQVGGPRGGLLRSWAEWPAGQPRPRVFAAAAADPGLGAGRQAGRQASSLSMLHHKHSIWQTGRITN